MEFAVILIVIFEAIASGFLIYFMIKNNRNYRTEIAKEFNRKMLKYEKILDDFERRG